MRGGRPYSAGRRYTKLDNDQRREEVESGWCFVGANGHRHGDDLPLR